MFKLNLPTALLGRLFRPQVKVIRVNSGDSPSARIREDVMGREWGVKVGRDVMPLAVNQKALAERMADDYRKRQK